MQSISFFKHSLMLGAVQVMSLVLMQPAVALDPFAEYDLVMYERPGFPDVEETYYYSPGLKPLWIKALKRPDEELQRMVIDTIAIAHKQGLSGLDEVRPDLVALLAAPEQSVDIVRSAASALIAMDAREHAGLLAKVAIERGGTVSQIIEPALARWKSPEMQKEWMDRLSDPNSSNLARLLAVDGVSDLELTSATEPLEQIVRQTVAAPSVRLASARALGKIHADGLVDLAKDLAGQSSKPTGLGALLAIELLGRHTDDGAVVFLTELLSNPSPAVQGGALGQLYRIDVKLVEARVDDFIGSPDANVRSWCARAMIAGADLQRIKVLAKMLDDVNPSLRREVARGLKTLAEDKELRVEVLNQVSEVLAQNSWRGCEQASALLAKLDHKPAGKRMVELLGHERGEVKVATAWGLTQLRMEEHLPAMLEHAQSVYDGFGSGQINDSMPGFSLQVAHLFIAFGDLRYREAEPLLRAYLPKNMFIGYYSRPAAAWALGLIYEDDPKADLVAIMLERLNDVNSPIQESDDVRLMCAVSLGRMKAESAIADLRKYSSGLGLAGRGCGWAIEKLTGEAPRSIPPSSTQIEGWFLSPIPPVIPRIDD